MIKNLVKSILPKSVWAFLRSKRIDYMIKMYQPKVRSGIYGGHALKVSLQDPLGEGWYGHDWDFSKELDILKKFKLKPGAKVFDLGAHQSVVAMILAKEVGSNGKILALEASEHNSKVGDDNKKLNDLQQLENLHAAVGKTTGLIQFSNDLNGAINNLSTTSICKDVRSFSIDDLVKKYFQPDLIIMDIEGYEALALEGAGMTLATSADWYIEVHGPKVIGHFGRTVDDVLKPFLTDKYQLFMGLENSDFVPFDAKSPLLEDRFFLLAHHI